MDGSSMYERCQADIEDLHRCIFDWCLGNVGDTNSAWERFALSWTSGFRLADADGLVEGSKRLLDLRVRLGERVDDPLRAVWIEGYTGYQVAEDLFQAYYEEWRRRASGQERGRAWSVLLRDGGQGPHGVEWVHAHRTWLAEDAFPSFRPPEASEPPADAGAEAPEEAAADVVPWAASAQADDGDVADELPWRARKDDEPAPVAPPPAPAAEVPPLTAIRAFFGDAEAQSVVGSAPPEFDQHNPELWLRELRKGGPEAVLRAGLVVLGHLLKPWTEWFPQEGAPGQIHAALTRTLEGDAQGLEAAKALAPAAWESAALAKAFEPDEPPEGFRTYAHKINAAEAAARLADAAGGSAIALGVKLSPVLEALPQSDRLALRPAVLEAFAGQG